MATMTDSPTGPASELRPPARGWLLVAEQEIRDLWLGTRGPVLLLCFSLLLSVLTYLAATNKELNLLDHKDTLKLVMQVAVGIGVALTLLVSADAVSGERERRTLESLLLTPLTPRQIALGKLLASMSIWAVVLLLALPYAWTMRVGFAIFLDALASGALVGTLLAIGFGSLGILVSTFSGGNRVSLVVSAFVFIALLVPSQLPGGATKGWLGELLVYLNPVASGARFMDKVVVSNHMWSQEAQWLLAPLVAAIVGAAGAAIFTGRLRLQPGVGR